MSVDPFVARRRILHVTQPGDGGVARYVDDVSRYQAERGWQVHVAGPDRAWSPAVTGHPWRAHRNPLLGVPGESRRLSAIIDDVAPDTVVLHSAKAGLVGRLVLRGQLPTVYLPHAWSFLALPSPWSASALAWERTAARWTNLVVAVSAGEARIGVDAGITAPMVVVPNPAPTEWSDGRRRIPTRARRHLGLPPRPTVVSVGRLCRQKGQDLLLEAWHQVRAAVDAQLVLVGDGPMRGSLADAADRSVILAGPQAQVQPWLQAADVVALPSRWEGMALSMLEALAMGRSVVTNHVAGSEVVVNARAGVSVTVGDHRGLADALITRLQRRDLARREGVRGARYVADHHRAERSFQALSTACLRAGVFGPPTAESGWVRS